MRLQEVFIDAAKVGRGAEIYWNVEIVGLAYVAEIRVMADFNGCVGDFSRHQLATTCIELGKTALQVRYSAICEPSVKAGGDLMLDLSGKQPHCGQNSRMRWDQHLGDLQLVSDRRRMNSPATTQRQ